MATFSGATFSGTEFLRHVTRDGDRWDLLAYDYYGDPLLFEPIIAANPTAPIRPILPGGITLQIPLRIDAAAPAAPGLPPWKKSANQVSAADPPSTP